MAQFYIETRITADKSKPGSRWERRGEISSEAITRKAFDRLRGMPGLDKRLVKLDGDVPGAPLRTVVEEILQNEQPAKIIKDANRLLSDINGEIRKLKRQMGFDPTPAEIRKLSELEDQYAKIAEKLR